MGHDTSISVVIPTYKRHEEVLRAIRSALAQTLPPLEVVVVNDGPDPEKARLIAALEDTRVRFHEAPRRGSASATRIFGIRSAQGDWIALLDDDDIWRPIKLQAQFDALDKSPFFEAILAAHQKVYPSNNRFYLRPTHAIPSSASIDDILFIYGGVHTSTLVAPKYLFVKHKFDEAQPEHEDWSWVLHAGRTLPMVIADDIACDRHLHIGTGLSTLGGFDYTKTWYENHKKLMGFDGRAAFVSGFLSSKAAYDRRLWALLWLFAELVRVERMSPNVLGRVVRPWILPTRLRSWIKRYLWLKKET